LVFLAGYSFLSSWERKEVRKLQNIIALTLALSQRAREKRNFNPKSEIKNRRSFALLRMTAA
jgi:hypothetical protein